MSLGEKLQSLRRARGLSQEQLALALNVSRQAVSKWETGESTPDLDKLRALSAYFGVTTDYLIWDDRPAERSAPAPEEAAAPETPAVRKHDIRAFVRKNAHWAGYAVAIVGAALLCRTLFQLLAMSLMFRRYGDLAGDEGYLAAVFDSLSGLLSLMLPYLLLYAALLAGGLVFARWYKARLRRQTERAQGEAEQEAPHDDV